MQREMQRRGHPIDDASRSLFAGRMTELIPRDAPRSEYDPDIEAAAAVATPIALHPVTGAFADPTHERAFAAYVFRLCFGVHLVSMALFLFTCACGWAAISTEATNGYGLLTLIYMFVGFLGLISRVRIHQWDDTVRAQRMGARIWPAFMALGIACEFFGLSKHATCEDVASWYSNIYSGLSIVYIVLLTGSHGMGFTHKFGLMSAVTLEPLWLIRVCGLRWAPYLALAGADIAVSGSAHLAEIHLRHNYADKQRPRRRK